MNFVVLPHDTEFADAWRHVADASYVVLAGADGAPLALLTASLLDSAADHGSLSAMDWPPVITIPATMSAEEFVATPGVTLLDLSDDVPGVVLVDGDRPVGVVPIETIDHLAASGGFEPPPTTRGPFGYAGDAALAGEVSLPSARVRCAAPGCGFVNTLVFFDRTVPPPCANPGLPAHRLTVAAG
jgi:hypothetical protein